MRAHIRDAQLAHQESLGVCLYDTLQETLHVARINDVASLGTRETLACADAALCVELTRRAVKQKARPTAMCVPAAIGLQFFWEAARAHCAAYRRVTCSRVGERLYEQLAENELEPATPFSVTTLKGHEFSLEAAHNVRLARARFATEVCV